MVFTSRVQSSFFGPHTQKKPMQSNSLIRLPLSVVPHYETRCPVTGVVMPSANKKLQRANLWSSDEHDRFLHGLEMFPKGPWKEIAKVVGTKTTRQTMTHAQKYRQKIERHSITGHGKWNTRDDRANATTVTTHTPHDRVSYDSINRNTMPNALQSTTTYTLPSPCETSAAAFEASIFHHEFPSRITAFPHVPVATTRAHIGDQCFDWQF